VAGVAAGAVATTQVMEPGQADASGKDSTGLDIMSTGEAVPHAHPDTMGDTVAHAPVDAAAAAGVAAGAGVPARRTPTPVKPEGGLPTAYSPKREAAAIDRTDEKSDEPVLEDTLKPVPDEENDLVEDHGLDDFENDAVEPQADDEVQAESASATADEATEGSEAPIMWAQPQDQELKGATVVPCGPADVDSNTGELIPIGTPEEIAQQHSGQIPVVGDPSTTGEIVIPDDMPKPRSIEIPTEKPSIFNTGSFAAIPNTDMSEVADTIDSEKAMRQSEREIRKAEKKAEREARKAEKKAEREARKAAKQAKKDAKGKPKSPTRQ